MATLMVPELCGEAGFSFAHTGRLLGPKSKGATHEWRVIDGVPQLCPLPKERRR